MSVTSACLAADVLSAMTLMAVHLAEVIMDITYATFFYIQIFQI